MLFTSEILKDEKFGRIHPDMLQNFRFNFSFIQGAVEWHVIQNNPQIGYPIRFANVDSAYNHTYTVIRSCDKWFPFYMHIANNNLKM